MDLYTSARKGQVSLLASCFTSLEAQISEQRRGKFVKHILEPSARMWVMNIIVRIADWFVYRSQGNRDTYHTVESLIHLLTSLYRRLCPSNTGFCGPQPNISVHRETVGWRWSNYVRNMSPSKIKVKTCGKWVHSIYKYCCVKTVTL
jgi:hypothetical protein